MRVFLLTQLAGIRTLNVRLPHWHAGYALL
jgi:hypothetical protein